MFRPELEAALRYGDGAKGGRPPFDPVMMFKILVIQAQNNLGDDRAEFLINDRLSFMRFLGLGLTDREPRAEPARPACASVRPELHARLGRSDRKGRRPPYDVVMMFRVLVRLNSLRKRLALGFGPARSESVTSRYRSKDLYLPRRAARQTIRAACACGVSRPGAPAIAAKGSM